MGGTGLEESTDESAKWSGEETEESATDEEAKTAVGAGEAQGPAGAPPRTPPPRTHMQQDREADMERKKGKGRGFPANGKTRPSSPLEGETKRGALRPPEWRKTPGGITREWEGDLSC